MALRYCGRGIEDPMNEAQGAAVAATIQGVARFGRAPGVACGLAVGAFTYGCMKYLQPWLHGPLLSNA